MFGLKRKEELQALRSELYAKYTKEVAEAVSSLEGRGDVGCKRFTCYVGDSETQMPVVAWDLGSRGGFQDRFLVLGELSGVYAMVNGPRLVPVTFDGNSPYSIEREYEYEVSFLRDFMKHQ